MYFVLLKAQHFHADTAVAFCTLKAVSGALALCNQPSVLTTQPVLCSAEEHCKERK